MCFKDDLAFSLIALGIIGYIYTVFEFIIILPWLGWSVVGKAHLVVVNTLAFMLLYSYFAASFTDPGSPPDDYDPEEGKGMWGGETVGKAGGGGMKNYCKRCRRHKPPRAHHCSQCGKCVLKMDHHCPWVNNCVGARNHLYFIHFLFYVVVALTYVLVTTVWRLTAFFPIEDADEFLSPGVAVLVAVALFLTVLVLLGVGFLFGFQMSIIVKNTTTIESWEFEDASRRARRRGKRVHHTYDLGWRDNLYTFFGSNVFLWLCPFRRPPGDGIHFKTYDFSRAPGVVESVGEWKAQR